MIYCQHVYRLRLVRPGIGEQLSQRKRDRGSQAFLDGLGGTQVEIHGDETGFDIAYALRIGALAELPCLDHPGEPIAAPDGSDRRG